MNSLKLHVLDPVQHAAVFLVVTLLGRKVCRFLNVGCDPLGTDSFAVQIADESHWDIHALIIIVNDGSKNIGSTVFKF